MSKKIILLLILVFFRPLFIFSQNSSEYAEGYKITFNEDGSKYFRIVSWGQFWLQVRNVDPSAKSVNLSIRRARVLTYVQLNKKFLILTHFGLNHLNGGNATPTGKEGPSQLFFHDFWGEFRIYKNHYVGAGLHYWNGISRLTSQSTLKFLTLDNNRQSWPTLGLTSQLSRHIGVYFKGKFKKLQYRLSINEAIENNLQANVEESSIESGGPAVYAGRRLLGADDAGFAYAGYLDYNILDQESNFMPFKVGTYLGSKKVLNVGIGFFVHPNGSVIRNNAGDLEGQHVLILGVDAFYDAPLGSKNSAITAYLSYQNTDYGRNYEFGTTYATGNMIYTHVGYLVPGQKDKVRVQPYASALVRTITATNNTATRFGVGTNVYLTGYHSKISLEYSNAKYGNNAAAGTFTLQAMVFL